MLPELAQPVDRRARPRRSRAGRSRGSRRRSRRRSRASVCLISREHQRRRPRRGRPPAPRRRAGRGRPGRLATTCCGDLADVLAAVAVLGRRLALARREQRRGEAVDLGAVVVEVVLARDLGAGRRRGSAPSASPTAAQRARPRCSGPVGLAETNSRLICSPGQRVAACRTPPRPSTIVARRRSPWAPASTRDVEEARPGDLDPGDARRPAAAVLATSSANVARVQCPPSCASCSATLVA